MSDDYLSSRTGSTFSSRNVPPHSEKTIAVIIPAYKVARQIEDVVAKIPDYVSRIYVVDDACPENTGKLIADICQDKRLRVLYHEKNQGVGGAVLTGFRQALEDGADILVKVDGDGQMDPRLLPLFVEPICNGEADYTKGNRFFDLTSLEGMPKIRLMGNAALSFLTKLSSGYWNIFDPTNGYVAIHASVARLLPFDKISKSYFFEIDMLFRLNTYQALVVDIPMKAVYGEEKSSLKISRILCEFLGKSIRNFIKRVFYNYYLRDMTAGSFELPIGLGMLLFGSIHGTYHFIKAVSQNIITPTGTIMLSTLTIIVGIQFLLAFLANDMANIPRTPIHKKLSAVHISSAGAGKEEA